MKILFLTPYPQGEAPSQRFRFEQYLEILSQQGHQVVTRAFLPSAHWRVFYSSGKVIPKMALLMAGIFKRIWTLFSATQYDFIFIHRETTPIGPPVFEWVIAKILRKKIIYDFDDAIWMTDKTNENWLEKTIRWRTKVSSICQWSYKVSCGNQYLCSFAGQFNKHIVLNPTTIDTELLHNPGHFSRDKSSVITIGWTGSHSTLKYLKSIEQTLQKIERKFHFVRFLVIADKQPDLKLTRLQFAEWRKATEAADLSKIDIGIMPLPDDEWAKGKCGFKALQYMALEIPCVVSPVGVNTLVVDNGTNGFWATSEDEWESSLEKLITDELVRTRLGKAGRNKVETSFSVNANTTNFLSLFR